jgi:glycosyltransferase involved in cell wall biosynthesis
MDARVLFWRGTGSGRYFNNLLINLMNIDYADEYFLYFGELHESDKTRLENDFQKVVVRSFSCRHLPVSTQALLWDNVQLPPFLKSDNIDIFHSPYYILPLIKSCKLVVTVHDLIFEIFPSDYSLWDRLSHRTVTRSAVQKADKVIVPSTCTKQDVMRLYGVPEKKIEVIYEAADDNFRPIDKPLAKKAIEQKYGIKDNFILYVGSIRPRKNIEKLVKAFYNLRKDYKSNFKLVVAGKVGMRIDFNGFIKRFGLENEVVHTEYVSDDDLPLLYNAAELFVYPSLYEGFGLPPLEAMACGTPVIASNIPSIAEVINDAGVLVDPQNEKELTLSMRDVLENEDLKKELRRKGIARARSFSWKDMAKKTLEAYQEVVNY